MTEQQTVDLVDWLGAIKDEEERWTRVAIRTAEHGVTEFDLDRIAADRKILELHKATDWCGPTERSCQICHEDYSWGPDHGDWPCATLKALASPYEGREGWQESWGHE